MKEKIKKNILYFIIIYILILLVCFELTKNYAVIDHYNMFNKGYVRYALEEFFKDGRIFSGIYILIESLLNIQIQCLYIFSILIGIGVVTFNILYFKEILTKKENSSKEWQWIVLSLITVFNWTCINNMNYIEFPIIALSIFLYMYSAKKFVMDKNIKLSLLAMTFAIFCYQGTLCTYFATIFFLNIYTYNNNSRQTIKKVIKGFLVGIIPILINFVFIKIYGNIINLTTRTDVSLGKIIYNFNELGTSFKQIFTYSTFALPKYLFLLFLLIILIIAIIIYIIKKDKFFIIKILSIMMINTLSCIPLILYFYGSNINLTARLLWSIGAMVGMCLVVLYRELENINVEIVIRYIVIIYMICQFYGMNFLIYRMKLGNEIDKSICNQLQELRTKIREEENIEIDRIMIKEELTRRRSSIKI